MRSKIVRFLLRQAVLWLYTLLINKPASGIRDDRAEVVFKLLAFIFNFQKKKINFLILCKITDKYVRLWWVYRITRDWLWRYISCTNLQSTNLALLRFPCANQLCYVTRAVIGRFQGHFSCKQTQWCMRFTLNNEDILLNIFLKYLHSW